MALTAYDACEACTGKTNEHPAYCLTRLGTKALPNRTIAVDPNVIPLGSWVYIDGYGLYRAEDTGGAIKGNKIDVFMANHNDALEFGIRNATARVIPAYLAENNS